MELCSYMDDLALRAVPLGAGSLDDDWEIPVEAYAVLHRLAKNWTDISSYRNLSLKPLRGAMTNQVFECLWASKKHRGKPRKVLVRVYGESSELFFSRESEILTFERMSQQGQGPQLLARFHNGRVEEFLHARTLSAADLRVPEVSNQIAVKLREFHGLDMPGAAQPFLWQRLSLWLDETLKRASTTHIEEFRLHHLSEEIAELEKRIRTPDEMIGFCHNDLQYGNVMIDENDNTITIIDYEYASFNPVAFDIANHFCEMAADYHTDTPHILDYGKFPHYEERRIFITVYLQALDGTVHETDIEDLMKATDAYTLASHLLWGLWGIISALTSDIDFNYLEYARQRFEQYYFLKPIIFGGSGQLE